MPACCFSPCLPLSVCSQLHLLLSRSSLRRPSASATVIYRLLCHTVGPPSVQEPVRATPASPENCTPLPSSVSAVPAHGFLSPRRDLGDQLTSY